MIYIISFYSDEYPDTESDFLLDDHSDICEGHIRIGEINPNYTSMICELYRVYNEAVFIKLIQIMQEAIPHLEVYKQII